MDTFTDKYNRLISDFTQAFEQYEFPQSFDEVDESDKLVLEVYNEFENEYRVVTLNGIDADGGLITNDGDYLFQDVKVESMVELLDYLA
jgi:hypothetical protein